LRDQYGPDLAERIELDGTYALLRYRGRLFTARDRIVASIDPPAVRGLRTQIVKRRLAGWQLPAHASALEAVVESGFRS
jgi:hypothetical protein